MAKDRSWGDRGTGFTERKMKDFGRGSRWCKRCGCYTSCIKKYDLQLCRQCFREVANTLGFKKYR